MKKSFLIIKSLIVMGALFMVSCNTDDSINCPDPLTGDLNAIETEFSGQWEFSGMMADEAVDITDDKKDNASKDIYQQYTACQRDEIYNFMANRSYSYKQGSVATDCNNKQQLTGTWSLEDGKSMKLVVNCGYQTSQITVDEAGKTFSLVNTLSIHDVNGVEKTTKVTFTYTKVEVEETPQ